MANEMKNPSSLRIKLDLGIENKKQRRKIMEIKKRLLITFKATDDNKVSLSIDDPR